MNHFKSRRAAGSVQSSKLSVALAVALTGVAGVSHAQTETQSQAVPAESAMVRLIRGLIESGALTKETGETLLAQAQAEALATQRTQAQAASAAAATAQTPAANLLRPEPGDVRVPYVPQTVRDEIRAELKSEVMTRAKAEGWASPNETPAWTKRVRVESDVRVRNESRLFSDDNSDIEVDWAAVNKGKGYDLGQNNVILPPLTNTREDRKNLWRVRARFGVVADISERTHAGIRVATGSDNSPVSTNQTLGGGLDKDDIWIDQAWLSHRVTDWLTLTGGRFQNPFMSTDLVFDEDLNFDGVAAQLSQDFGGVRVFGNLGYTPLEYSSDSFPSSQQQKMKSETKYLLAAQLGADWQITERQRLKGAAAWYDFRSISGITSQPCDLRIQESCSTDWTRPAFMQKGNTLMLLRDIVLDPLDPANTPLPQYVLLAAEFELLDVNLSWQARVGERLSVRVDGDYVRNLAYDEKDIWVRSRGRIVNNFGSSGGTGQSAYESGDSAYLIKATFGVAEPIDRGDWNMHVGYKRIEPDALPDAYTDSDFHLGGTNARGYFVGASVAFDKRAWFTGRWIATKEVYGAPLSIDTLQLDFNARF